MSRSKIATIRLLIFLMFCSTEIMSFGQTNKGYSITGSLIDSLSKQPLEYASAALYKSIDNSLLTGAITNVKGVFTLNNIPTGKFFLKLSFIGYKTKITNIEISNASVDLYQPILMNSTSLSLGEVQVIGKQNEKQINVEKTKINVAQNISAVSGNITDVLRSQSSITIDANDNVYLNSSKNDSRVFWVGITYNINSFKPSKAQNNSGTESDNALIKLGQ